MDKKQSVRLTVNLGNGVELPRGLELVAHARWRFDALDFNCPTGFQGFPHSRKRNHW
ncbi:hypothetical protein [Salipiger sp. PrR002]|uniref:hypothetical protein n=1 Tax=Salipiger sp. PrR002 TaxID=2706489 RepID=UPI0013B5BAC8|nr:hypothetical protein [Salipiger sp. PrR002]NDW02475.1 hypothetical protein [Salipiger sp. PrR002]NDW59654.1 hypothetical protein [Salipiger sp. PrR004]